MAPAKEAPKMEPAIHPKSVPTRVVPPKARVPPTLEFVVHVSSIHNIRESYVYKIASKVKLDSYEELA